MDKLYANVTYRSLVKHGEELCGDKVYRVEAEDSSIVVMADGLGSGVKANILATLTSKIAGEMLKNGASIDDVMMTVAETLPVCKVRNLAYSTFTIFQVFRDGKAYLIEYDNPPAFYFKNGMLVQFAGIERMINGRRIKESYFELGQRDTFVFVSDGVVHAGVGKVLNLGWQWDNVADYIQGLLQRKRTTEELCLKISESCQHLYCDEPGDDATVVCVQFRPPSPLSLLIGPPRNPAEDEAVVERWYAGGGKKVVCGGTSANIVARIFDKAIDVQLSSYGDGSIPPIATMEGVDLVTEGVLTLRQTLRRLKEVAGGKEWRSEFPGEDGVSRLLQLMLCDSTEIRFHVGTAINPAHQNPDFPQDLNIKLNIIAEMNEVLKKLGKQTSVMLY